MNNLLSLMALLNIEYCDFSDNDLKYMCDNDVTDCLMKLYFCMLTEDEERYNEFINIYEKLDVDRQEYIKEKYLEIINAQEGKVKEKKYE